MSFIADLHIHSYLSRATSRECNLEGLQRWAQLKGVRVVGTGDCTHPTWLEEIRAKLVPSAPGLFRLRPDLATAVDAGVPAACRAPVDFAVSGEISSIYKRDGRTRKVHSLLLLPDLDSAVRLSARLDALGNVRSDGRPILGIDPRDLLSLTLETHPQSLFIPAHIWTPWFSMLGSMSGFDSPDECFGDLIAHVFAVETGLSSDPPMNWRVSSLDRFALISNSDLHSPANLGRNASLYHVEPDFFAMRRALQSKDPAQYGGTLDLFPEEGKYHGDGHRKCNVCLEPEESLRLNGLCPTCGKPLVLGVLHRVNALADRPRGARPSTAASHAYIIPLPELLAEILACGDTAQKVQRVYTALLARFGNELSILRELPPEALEHADVPLLGEAVRRLRSGQVIRSPGYDGEYGRISVFRLGEMDELRRQGLLLRMASTTPPRLPPPLPPPAPCPAAQGAYSLRPLDSTTLQVQESPARLPLPEHDLAGGQMSLFGEDGVLAGLSLEQRQAAAALDGPVLIVAGPGTGKTRTLTHRIAHLVADRGEPAATILAVTFTNRAATEIRKRLHALLGGQADAIATGTFHSLCLKWLRHLDPASAAACLIDDLQERDLLAQHTGLDAAGLDRLQHGLEAARHGSAPAAELPSELRDWESVLTEAGLLPLDEIIPRFLRRLRADPAARQTAACRWLCVDEFQDINLVQFELVRELAGDGRGLCVIGDPDQSIYGFRGSTPHCFAALRQECPHTRVFRLSCNYRSVQTLVAAAGQVMDAGRTELSVLTEAPTAGGLAVRFHAASSVAAEAEFIAHEIERWLGGTAHFSLDSGRVSASAADATAAFGDIAILVRLKAMLPAYAEALHRLGVPLRIAGGDNALDTPGVRRVLDAVRTAPRPQLAQPAESVLGALGADRLLAAPEWEALVTLCRDAAGGARTLAEVVDRILLRVPGDDVDIRTERVNLLTMHAAKGLEFPIVFIAGCEDGIVPFRRDGEPPNDAEERRMLYVAVTRARQALYLTHSRRRDLFGRRLPGTPSSFLSAISGDLIETVGSCRQARPGGKAVQLEFNLS